MTDTSALSSIANSPRREVEVLLVLSLALHRAMTELGSSRMSVPDNAIEYLRFYAGPVSLLRVGREMDTFRIDPYPRLSKDIEAVLAQIQIQPPPRPKFRPGPDYESWLSDGMTLDSYMRGQNPYEAFMRERQTEDATFPNLQPKSTTATPKESLASKAVAAVERLFDFAI